MGTAGADEKLGYRRIGQGRREKLKAEIKWGAIRSEKRRGSGVRGVGNREGVGSKGEIGDGGEQEQLIEKTGTEVRVGESGER